MAKINVGRWAGAQRRTFNKKKRVLNVPADVYDLRDRVYNPRLLRLPLRYDHRTVLRVPVRDQGDLGACTGFAMATVVNYLLAEKRKPYDASPRFLYENAKRYDEWRGAEYEGSSIRGAMKGFLRHGVCAERDAEYAPSDEDPNHPFPPLPPAAYREADKHPLGAYYRITTSSINDLQSAILETGAILASAQTHGGWDDPGPDGGPLARIAWKVGRKQEGGHAFALVGYDGDGFIVHNSWGTEWGTKGFAHLSYEDWLASSMDAWVAQIGVGCVAHNYPRLSVAVERGLQTKERPVAEELIRGHYLAIRNGAFNEYGPIRTMPGDLPAIVENVRAERQKAGKRLKVLFFAHGGLVGDAGASHKALALKKELLDENGIYPIHLIWHTDLWEEIVDLIAGKQRHVQLVEPGLTRGAGEWLQNAMDGTVEATLRVPGHAVWKEMKEDARDAAPCVGRLVDLIARAGIDVEYHLAGHSAGAILHCHLAGEFAQRQIPVQSLTFWAPAVSVGLFAQTARPLVESGGIRRFALHTMSDEDERSDACGPLYHKSLLYLVSYSFEDQETKELLGLARHVWEDHQESKNDVDARIKGWLSTTDPRRQLVLGKPAPEKAGATLHGAYDDDPAMMKALIARIDAPPRTTGRAGGSSGSAARRPRRPKGGTRIGGGALAARTPTKPPPGGLVLKARSRGAGRAR